MKHSISFLLLSYLIFFASAYYDDPKGKSNILISVTYGAFVTVGDAIYTLGGRISPTIVSYSVERYSFLPNQTLETISFPGNSTTRICFLCQGYALPDNRTIVVLDVSYTIVDTYKRKSGIGFYDTIDNSWSYPDGPGYSDTLPRRRGAFSSAISPKGDALYSIGGIRTDDEDTYVLPYGILKYDLINRTSVVDMSLEHPNLRIGSSNACANMLPDGKVVIAFGLSESGNLYNTSEVFIFDTNTNEINTQPISGNPPSPRVGASSVLGPDKSTIYYFGGADAANNLNVNKGIIFNDVPILDTKTWSWVQFSIPGMAPKPVKGAGMVVFGSNKIVISPGTSVNFNSNNIAVLDGVPGVGDSIQSSNMRWFTNFEPYDNPPKDSHLSDGSIAGIVIGVLVIFGLIMALLYRYVPASRKTLTYIQQDMIWNPRSGEPLWAETARLLVRFILLFLILAFIAYVIFRAITSPVISQEIITKAEAILSPDFRFCFDGFSSSSSNPPAEDTAITCNFRNGTSCSHYIIPLDSSVYSPEYTDQFGDVKCHLFLPGPDFRLIYDEIGYTDSTGTKMLFSFFGTPDNPNDTSAAVIYIDFYAPGYDHNVNIFNLTSIAGETKYSPEENEQWKISEQAFNLVDTIILKQGVRSTASYTLINVEDLREDDGWNYVGFSSTYDKSMKVKNKFKDAPQSIKNMPFNGTNPGLSIAMLTIQPDAFVVTTLKDQKIFTLLNAFAQVGGVLGLFIALQTLLFGFRPQSPWGIVHRWSFGNLRIKLTDRLANYFNKTGTPVPLVNPVNDNRTDLHHFFKNNDNVYIPFGPGVPSASEDQMENPGQEYRVKRVEERLQLMELLLKSYYLDDEVFRSLDQAVKRGNEEKRRSSLIQTNGNETDSVLRNDALNEEYNDVTNINRRPSSTNFQMQNREQYQPNLAINAPLELYDEEHELGKR